MTTRFVSEPILPLPGTMDTRSMAIGEPGLPGRFIWRGKEYVVDAVLEKWKETSGCRHGGDEQYVRKHWFRVRTVGGDEMRIYFERQPRSARERKLRWWLFTRRGSEGTGDPALGSGD